jgi:Fe-S oxidoreductase
LIYLIKALSENWTNATPEMAELAYECTLCETCDMCEIIPVPAPHTTPSDLIRFLRHLLVKNGVMPEKIRRLQAKLKKSGTSEKKVQWKTQDRAGKMPKTVLFMDGSSTIERKLHRHALSLLGKMGNNAAILDHSGATSGADLYDLGLWDELKKEIDRNAGEVAKLEGKEVVFLNPHTQEFMTRKYGDLSSSNPAIKARHFSELLREAFKKGKLKALKGKKLKVAYHDPCRLSRSLGIYAAPRDVLKFINLEVIEMKRNREDTYCCGAGSINPAYGAFARKVAEERIKEFLETGAEVLVTACPYCEEVFSNLLGREKGKVRDLVEIVDERTEKVS